MNQTNNKFKSLIKGMKSLKKFTLEQGWKYKSIQMKVNHQYNALIFKAYLNKKFSLELLKE